MLTAELGDRNTLRSDGHLRQNYLAASRWRYRSRLLELCLKWGVILFGPGYAGKWPICEAQLLMDGWTPQKMSVEWNQVDVALFSELPRNDEHLHVVVEAKKMDNSCL